MREAVGGIRVSTAQQVDAYGPDRQRQEILREAERAGLTVTEWVEEAVSGASTDRAAENRYYQLARERPGLNLIFAHPNRVGRHVEVTVGIARQIHRLGGTVWIAGLGNLRDGRNWRYFLRDAVESESEYANLVSQMAYGKRSKAASGRWAHGAVPWGYVLERDGRGRSTLPAPDPPAAAAVRRVFELSEAWGETRVLRAMREEGWPAPTAAGWTIRTVKNVLKNERYTGRAVFQGLTLEFPAIVPREQWQAVQERRSLRRRESGPRDTSLLWSGHVRCAVCGSAIGRDGAVTRYGRYIYYRCWRARRGHAQRLGQTPCSNTASWPPQAADEAWWSYLTAALSDPRHLPSILPPLAPPVPTPPPARVAELEAAIARAWEPYAAGKVPLEVAERLAAPYVAELERLRAEYAPAPAPEPPDYRQLAAQFVAALHAATGLEQRRGLLALLDVRLYVGPRGPERLSVSSS